MWLDNFNEMRRVSGMSLDELSEKAGVPKSTLAKITSGITKAPALETMRSLVYAMGYTLNELDDATPLTSVYSQAEIEIIKKYRALDLHGKNAVLAILDCEAVRCSEDSNRARVIPANIIPLRCSVQSASAGTGMYLGPEEFETIFVEENDLTRRAAFGVPVRGDSMEPAYHDGDILIVEAAEDVAVGETGVFTVSGDGYVKKRGENALISLNPKYAPVALTEDTWCNGRVIGVLAPAWIVKK